MDPQALKTYYKPNIPPITELLKELGAEIPIIEEEDEAISTSQHEYIIKLNDRLFFVHYTPQGMLLKRWYLFQVDIESTLQTNANAS